MKVLRFPLRNRYLEDLERIERQRRRMIWAFVWVAGAALASLVWVAVVLP